MVSALPAWRREQALRYRHLQGQRECALSYHLLCHLLQEHYGIHQQPTFLYEDSGKPFLREYPHIHFSISHCRTAVGCVVSDKPCGLDIESLRPLRQSLVEYAMNSHEQQQIALSPTPQLEFLKLWTSKEAVLKLQGTGIAGHLKDCLSPSSVSGIQFSTTITPAYVYTLASLQEA